MMYAYTNYIHRALLIIVYKIILAFSLLYSIILVGQVPTSLSISPYTGINRIHLNPALGIKSNYTWDVTLADAHLFADTDYSFVRKASLLNLSGRLNAASVIDGQSSIPEQSDLPLIIFDEDLGQKQAFLNGRINGPSFTYNVQSDLRVGIFTSLRAHMSSNDIPENFGIYELNQSYSTNIIDVTKGSFSVASWMEIGLHASKKLEEGTIGFNIRLLRGHEGAYANSDITTSYPFVDSTVTIRDPPNFELAFTNSSINANGLKTDFNGSGIAIDLGFTSSTDFLDFGISIMDIGVIQYKSNVEIYTADILANVTQIRTQDYRGFSTLRNLIDQFQNDQNIVPDQFGVFSVGLPTRLSLFGDYKFNKDISISANINQRLPIFSNSLKSINTLVITPRYETPLYSLFFPITIYEYQSLRIGTAFRIGPLTIGSDHISSVLFSHDFHGSDIFMSLNLFPFKQDNGGKHGSGKGVLCPMF